MVAPGSETVRSLDNGFSHCFGNAFEHSLENPLMEGIKDIPIEKPQKSLWDIP
jgi:hypothetical protein